MPRTAWWRSKSSSSPTRRSRWIDQGRRWEIFEGFLEGLGPAKPLACVCNMYVVFARAGAKNDIITQGVAWRGEAPSKTALFAPFGRHGRLNGAKKKKRTIMDDEAELA